MPGEIDLKPRLRREPFNPEVLKRIDDLVALIAGRNTENSDLAREMIVTALKSLIPEIDRGDMKLLNQSIRELRYAFKIFGQYKDRKKITLFGSARSKSDDPAYKQALSFARMIRNAGYMVITGAGPGIMQAGNQGAGPSNSFGINIRLPFEQKPNPYVDGTPRHLECRYFFTRKLLLAKEAHAGVFFPGGFGTHDEAAELLTLLQTGKAEMIPIVFVDVPGGSYWTDWQSYVEKHMLKPGRISQDDLHLFKITDKPKEACDEIIGFYRNYHSMRYVGRKLVLRIQRPPDPQSLGAMEKEFRDILGSGGIELSGALPEESGDELIADLPRLVIDYDRMHFGRLRQLIDRLNRN